MKKAIVCILVLVLCTTLLCGCRLSFRPFSGLSSIRYDDAAQYTAGGASLSGPVTRVEIEWISGSVTVACHKENTVSFSETASRTMPDDLAVHYWLDGTTLRIKFCRSGAWSLGWLEKDLTVLLPESLALEELKIDSVSAPVTVEAACAETMTLNTVSGDVRATDCAVTRRMRLDTTSGEIAAVLAESLEQMEVDTVSGRVEIGAPRIGDFDADTTSGSVLLTAAAAPEELDVDTVSGSVTLYLPENAGFTLEFDTVSGSFSSELAGRTLDDTFLCGDGAGDYRLSTTSGDVRLCQAK